MRFLLNYRRHMNKFLIVLLIFAIVLMREISIYWINISSNYGYIDGSGRMPYDLDKRQKISSELESILSSVWSVSDEQVLIEPRTIIKTLKFMIEERNETDPELVEFVRSLIKQPVSPDREHPSNRKPNLINPKKYNDSHTGASKFIDQMLEGKRSGFFIEAGANDGEDISNSLFFELERGWTGK